MIGGKAAGAARPTALGTLLSSGAYGQAVTQCYGTARLAPMPIWAAHLRKGGSGKKGKGGKKGATTYVESIDMLLCTNPCAGVLQIWSNQSNQYTLNFMDLTSDFNITGDWPSTLTITDPDFYFVVGVSLEMGTDGLTFNDYGAPGPSVYDNSGNWILPIWNATQHGPDLTDPNTSRWPVFCWEPSQLNVVIKTALDLYERAKHINIPNPGGFTAPFTAGFKGHVYYAQTNKTTKHKSPLSYNRFTFETELGNGTEYADAGLPAQQIIYPHLAGIESDNMDLGTSGAIPSWRMEVQGSYAFTPSVYSNPSPPTGGAATVSGTRADAELTDIIEDVIKSGMTQYGAALGYVQRGCNCNDTPGLVQTNFREVLVGGINPIPYFQPNYVGSILLAAFQTGFGGGGLVSDTNGNTWINVLDTVQGIGWADVSYVASAVGGPGGYASGGVSWAGGGTGNSGYLFEFDPGMTEVDNVVTLVIPTSITTQTTLSITTSAPGYILALMMGGLALPDGVTQVHWKKIFSLSQNSPPIAWGRQTNAAGVYTVVIPAGPSYSGSIVLFAVKAGQPAGTVPYPKALGNIIDYPTLFNMQQACRCGMLQGSLALDSQTTCADLLKNIYMVGNAAPVWSGFKLKSISRNEVSMLGDGSAANVVGVPADTVNGLAGCYWSPTSLGPVVNLKDEDFIGDDQNSLITIERRAQVDSENIIQIQHFDRNNKYNQAMTSEPDSATISIFGPRKADPITLNMIVDPQVARKVALIEGRRKTQLRNTYKFKLKINHMYLEAMDLVTIPLPAMLGPTPNAFGGQDQFPVRLQKITENENHELECEAEQFIYGLHNPTPQTVTVLEPFNPGLTDVPGPINTPIIFEPPVRICLSGGPELWFVVSDSDPEYGGSIIYISVDGGANYTELGAVIGNGTTGYNIGDWPAAPDPDGTNVLHLDLSESLGVLDSYSAQQENSFTYPNYIAGNTAPSYELMTYNVANLTSTYHYDLLTSNAAPLRRAVFGVPLPGQGEDHPNASHFAWLGSWEASGPASTSGKAAGTAGTPGTGVFKIKLDPTWINKTLYFKFTPFNVQQSGVQDITDPSVIAYTYTPTGVVSGGGTIGGGTGGQGSQQVTYNMTGGQLSSPTPTTIVMQPATVTFSTGSSAAYAGDTFTIPSPTTPTTYYVTIFDPNENGGNPSTLTYSASTSQTNVGVPGYLYIGNITVFPPGSGIGGSTPPPITGGGGYPPPEQILVNGV